jgi:hypothetical protein
VSGHPTPEEAVIAEDSVPPRFVNVVAVEYSPREDHAVVLIEYNEPPVVEPYVVLCENMPSGWVTRQGGSGGGLSWMATDAEGDAGVEVAWGHEPTVRWEVPPWDEPEVPPNAGRW